MHELTIGERGGEFEHNRTAGAAPACDGRAVGAEWALYVALHPGVGQASPRWLRVCRPNGRRRWDPHRPSDLRQIGIMANIWGKVAASTRCAWPALPTPWPQRPCVH